jgi:hypothetical protein
MGVLRASMAFQARALTATMATPCGAFTAFWLEVQQRSTFHSSNLSSAAPNPETESIR